LGTHGNVAVSQLCYVGLFDTDVVSGLRETIANALRHIDSKRSVQIIGWCDGQDERHRLPALLSASKRLSSMSKLEKKITDIDKRADESELLSKLAMDTDARAYNASVANKLRATADRLRTSKPEDT